MSSRMTILEWPRSIVSYPFFCPIPKKDKKNAATGD